MGWGWRPYVPVWKRQEQAERQMAKLRRKGVNIQPVVLEGHRIAATFWGKAWCEHLEKFSDFANRLPRGRSYVRNGAVCHLEIGKGGITAKVSGSKVYDVKVSIKTLPKDKWKRIRKSCAGRVGSMLELLQGKMSNEVMGVVVDRQEGLFPLPKEMVFDCSCPDWAGMCKHIAAVLYGVGARLDRSPELLFLLRGVDHNELVSEEAAKAVVGKASAAKDRTLDEGRISQVFGIELAETQPRNQGGPKKEEETAAGAAALVPTEAERRKGKAVEKRRRSRRRAKPELAIAAQS
jgi:uncharacterized Zn finger protein